ncbi:MAG: DUF3179 domain-containing protein [Chloroflexi bacterium]|nr:DUF3179 domain-containing protein [Chloroflexota bacterium]MCI0575776.1 DUF3179 domain-containing protein [Chloroflexota bacterium]MCI0643617.1 DUF3179 domain-containing protein [Chloroflexota bacterium]MCI0726835.1 DUF3179 domain-containing protein [Chloroflexota bacterium]
MIKEVAQQRTWWLAAWLLLALAACAPTGGEPAAQATTTRPRPTEAPAAEAVETAVPTEAAAGEDVEMMTEDDRSDMLRALTRSWNTNWNRHTIRYEEILSGGPPRDGIPSIDDPQFISPAAAGEWLAGNEPVVALEIDGDVRAYPLQILTWHEIVNDVVGGVPVIVTFCPLCNSAVAFDRRLEGEAYEFGTSGLLRHSDLIMYDRTTESLWQQFTGEAIAGDLAGKRLTFLPSSLVSFADFKAAYPQGVVLSRETGYDRDYGRNPYAGYDNIDSTPFLFLGVPDDRLPPMARVVTVSFEDVDVAYPLDILAEAGVINDTVAGRELVVFHTAGTSSALDASEIAAGADVGATGVFDPNLDGQTLIFKKVGEAIVDEQTNSTWNILGQAIDGPLEGRALTPIVHGDHFWFSWAAFKPETIIYRNEH